MYLLVHNVDVTATRDFRKYSLVYTTGSDFAANGNTTLGMWGLRQATVQKINLYQVDSNSEIVMKELTSDIMAA